MDPADQPELLGISLCSGGGGLDLGIELAIGPTRVVVHVEREAFAVGYLAEAMEAGWMAPSPIWTDLRTFDGRPFRGRVHFLTAGYPCQPFSLAGSRGGAKDPRHLWPRVRRAISQIQPGIVFLENVPGHASLGFEKVISDLRRLGYRATAGLYSAAEVGASHRRERLFILGLADPERAERRRTFAETGLHDGHGHQGRWPERSGQPGREGQILADPLGFNCSGRRESGLLAGPPRDPKSDGEQRQRSGCSVDYRGNLLAARRDIIPLFPPGPADLDSWRQVLEGRPDLAPALPGLRLVAYGMAADRSRWLRMLGNGVCPLAASYAFVSLFACLGTRPVLVTRNRLFDPDLPEMAKP